MITNNEGYLELEIGTGALGFVCPDDKKITLPENVSRLVMPVQTHTANVAAITDSDSLSGSAQFNDTDALVTQMKGIAVGVRTADCVPILLYAPDIKAVAAVHAGWRGTIAGIAANAIKKMTDSGADPSLIFAAFGPAICGDCYEVSPELADRFEEAGLGLSVIRRGTGRPHIDLIAANTLIMRRCGLSPERISGCGICTCQSGSYPSWRRSPEITDRLVTAICLT